MNPRHHPSESLLIDHAAGSLDPGASLVVRAHLGACPTCRSVTAFAEAVGGAMLSRHAVEPLADDALARALARVELPAQRDPPEPRPRPDWIAVPRPVLNAAQRRRRWAAPGVWVAPVMSDAAGVSTYLLRVGAGMSVPLHTHRGTEMICVLEGAYADGDSLHSPGDFACNDETVTHRPQVTRDKACVCLIAARGALVPRDWVGRLFQPIVGI